MIFHLFALLHNMLPAKVGLAGGKFMSAGVVTKANVLGHKMFLAQAANTPAVAPHQFLHTLQHEAGRMAHTAKHIGLAAQKGLNPAWNFARAHGLTTLEEIGMAGFGVAEMVMNKH